jgi:hypothetical protein
MTDVWACDVHSRNMHCACLISQHMRQAACFVSCLTPSWCDTITHTVTVFVHMHLLSLPSQHSLRVVSAGAASGLGALLELTPLHAKGTARR